MSRKIAISDLDFMRGAYVNALNKSGGFSLIELMVVISIISVIAAMGLPKYKQYTAKAKQSEAKMMLKQIYTAQKSYYAENDTHMTLFEFAGPWGSCTSTIKLRVARILGVASTQQDCNLLRYTYSTNNAGRNFAASAVSTQLFPACSYSDRWSTSSDQDLTSVSDSVKNCANQ